MSVSSASASGPTRSSTAGPSWRATSPTAPTIPLIDPWSAPSCRHPAFATPLEKKVVAARRRRRRRARDQRRGLCGSLQCGKDVRNVRFQHPRLLDHGLEPGARHPDVPAAEERATPRPSRGRLGARKPCSATQAVIRACKWSRVDRKAASCSSNEATVRSGSGHGQ
jgi:hypothetical protein